MGSKNKDLRELFAEARAIYFAMLNDAITYQQAKLFSEPILRRINTIVTLIAKDYEVKPTYIAFQDLGRNL